MSSVNIYKKDGTKLCDCHTPQYNGTFMGERTVTVNIKSPREIAFSVGDYLDYRGERFTLYLLPELAKTAKENTYGGAIEYKNVTFCSVEEELRRCMFLDVAFGDNGLHYTMLPNFSFYCEKPSDLAFRLQANLDRQYPNEWTVTVNDDAKFVDGVNMSFSNQTCWEALAQVNTNDDIDINFTIDGANKRIVIGGVGETLDIGLMYGKGNGLRSIERTVDTSQAVISRLYAYGNTRNLPYRYYNKKHDETSTIFSATRSMYLPNLMLPGILASWKGIYAKTYLETNGMCKKTPYTNLGYEVVFNQSSNKYYYYDDSGKRYEISKSDIKYYLVQHYEEVPQEENSYYCDRVWIDSADAIEDFGTLEGVKFFDGSDNNVENVYPSIENFGTAEDLADALDPDGTENSKYNFRDPGDDNWEISIPLGALNAIADYTPGSEITDDGNIHEKQTSTPTFDIIIKNIGFDPNDSELKADDTPRISMKSGMCAGREFKILSSQKMVFNDGVKWEVVTQSNEHSGPWGYKLRCEVAADESINQFFPNGHYPLMNGDQFVLLGINMPTAYVDVAEKKLLKQAILYLSDNDHTQFNFAPKIDNIFFARNPKLADKLREGNLLHIIDEKLGIDVTLPISSLRISNDKEIPEYEVTLSDSQEASLSQRVSADVKQTFSNYFYGFGGSGSAGTITAGVLNNYLKVKYDQLGKPYLYCTLDFAVQYGITAYSRQKAFVDTIMDGILVDGKTIRINEKGQLEVIK